MENSTNGNEAVTASPENEEVVPGDPSSPSAADQSQDDTSTVWPQPKRGIRELRNPVPFVEHMRQALFHLKEPIELKEEEFERYWPYIDNVWVRQHKAGIEKSGRSNIDYYACRLQRPTYTPRRTSQPRPDGEPRRKKKTREGGTCQVRAKVLRHQGEVKQLTICRIGEQEHTHDLDHLDKIKRNSAVMDIARSEVMKGYMPASVFTVMQEEPEKLAAIGGKYINRNDVRNTSQQWRQSFKGDLAVHPGYKYDLGNGILNINRLTDDAVEAPQPLLPAPQLPPLPADTLYFAPPMSGFLVSYLPSQQPVPPRGFPHVTLTYATSMDSFLALSPTTPTPISGAGTKAMTHYLRSCHDAILVGVGTAIADNPTLNCRLAGAGGYGGIGWMHHPRPIVIDPSARWQINDESNVLRAVKQGRGRAPWIIVAPGSPVDQQKIETLKAHGGKYLGLTDYDARYRLSWASIFRALADAGIRSVMVEGGGIVINELLRPENVGLVNNVIVTIAPTYLGTGGVVVCPNRRIDHLGTPIPALRFRDVRWQPLGEDVVMCGRLNASSEASGQVGPGMLGPASIRDPSQLPINPGQSIFPMRGSTSSTALVPAASAADDERANSVFVQLEQAAKFGPTEQETLSQ
ncbi:MAG: hypothetical protein LQ340_006574 [Diploschistes diacapsis]|nr:MAG: hypothetical protein LQ340_006574 [Diploschistes diacapsis]